MVLKLYYFDIIGIVESSRLLLTYAGIPFEDIRVQRSDWPALKATMPNGQMPVLELEDGRRLTQAGAVGLYIAKKAGLIPADDFDAAKAAELVAGYMDNLVKIRVFNALPDDKKVEYFNSSVKEFAKPRFEQLDKIYAQQSNSAWIFDKICWADFFNYNLVRSIQHFYGISVKDYPNLNKFYQDFIALPQLQDHFKKYKDLIVAPFDFIATVKRLSQS